MAESVGANTVDMKMVQVRWYLFFAFVSCVFKSLFFVSRFTRPVSLILAILKARSSGSLLRPFAALEPFCSMETERDSAMR